MIFQSGDVNAEQVKLLLSDPRENWDVVEDDPDFLLVGEKKVKSQWKQIPAMECNTSSSIQSKLIFIADNKLATANLLSECIKYPRFILASLFIKQSRT